MKQQRLLEILGSMALGGALVAIGYELGATRPGAATPTAAGAPAPAEAVEAVEDPVEATGSGEVEAADGGGLIERSMAAAQGGAGAPARAPARDLPPWQVPGENGVYQAYPPLFEENAALSPEDEAKFPKHGLVTGAAVVLRERTDLESPIVGVLRAGARVRVDGERSFGGRCTSGWHRVHPRGWICVNAGLEVGDTPPDDGMITSPSPRVDDPMPYDYWRVNHDGTPFFHRLPSFSEQDRADAAAKSWIAERGRELMPTDPKSRPADVPAVVKEYLNAGFYVTIAGEAVKSERRFLRSLRGVFARKYQLEQREGSKFQGIVLASEDDLPAYWIVRETGFFRREAEGSDVLVKSEKTAPRLARHPFRRKVVVGVHEHYEDADGDMMRAYAVGVARKIKRPPGVKEGESWVHVDLSEQTLVAYEGDVPVFATLVSTGREPGMTPVGIHRLQSKHIATSMRDQPIEEDAYSIEDVPWTQYFHNNVALHGAFCTAASAWCDHRVREPLAERRALAPSGTPRRRCPRGGTR
ncbi:MAG: L,D-transpeptidase [Nannocystaceae bacterium]